MFNFATIDPRFSFWLGLDAIPGRVTLLVTCMLTLVTMFTGLRAGTFYVAVNSYFELIDFEFPFRYTASCLRKGMCDIMNNKALCKIF